MNFDKAELERIWNDEPIGYLKMVLKRKKKEKTYIVKISSQQVTTNPEQQFEIVTTGDKWTAQTEATKKYKEMYPTLVHSQWRINVRQYK